SACLVGCPARSYYDLPRGFRVVDAEWVPGRGLLVTVEAWEFAAGDEGGPIPEGGARELRGAARGVGRRHPARLPPLLAVLTVKGRAAGGLGHFRSAENAGQPPSDRVSWHRAAWSPAPLGGGLYERRRVRRSSFLAGQHGATQHRPD